MRKGRCRILKVTHNPKYLMLYKIMLIAYAEDLRDIKPPLYFKTNPLFLLILCGIILSAILFFLTGLIFKKIKSLKGRPSLPPKTAHQIAYEALEELRLKGLPGLGKIREYYFELSGIVRRYTENRFNIKAPEMTTEEFLASLKDADILSGRHKNLLKDFLTLCDIVKFAKYGPSQKEIDGSYGAAKKFVEDTKADEGKKEEVKAK
ncbi:MAG: hypothetical protein A2Z72_02045 [Omnitrophica bacterium RBG_13_46_9]|nr:MAG: hypothetical protein A2Z72_02045 [Omnitrophica bacterium RBG_13_46_9]